MGSRRVDITVGIITQRAEGGGGFLEFHLHAELCLIEHLTAMTGGGTDDPHGKGVVADEGEERLGEFGGKVAQPTGFLPAFQTVDFQQYHLILVDDLWLEVLF